MKGFILVMTKLLVLFCEFPKIRQLVTSFSLMKKSTNSNSLFQSSKLFKSEKIEISSHPSWLDNAVAA